MKKIKRNNSGFILVKTSFFKRVYFKKNVLMFIYLMLLVLLLDAFSIFILFPAFNILIFINAAFYDYF